MSEREASPYHTTRIEPADTSSGFQCGKRPLDDYFARHAIANDQSGVGRAYVLREAHGSAETVPRVLGFYTLSMANITSELVAPVLEQKLPKYPMPVALIGRLAVDERAQGRRLGERLLIEALRRAVAASDIVGCIGVIVDAKDDSAESFYMKYGFVTVHAERWPRRMFLPISTAKAAFAAE